MGTTRLFELVTGTVRLDRLHDFERLHRDVLLPIFQRHAIKPFILLLTDVGVVGRFFDLYEYSSMSEYEELTSQLVADPDMISYYNEIQPCIIGSIEVQLLRAFSYSPIR
jgi:hypothetical protein